MDSSSNESLPWRARRGRDAEDRAATYLRRQGYVIIRRNVRVSHLEIDLVARDGDAVVVVEVRARGRGAWARPLATVDPRKRENLRRAAALLWRGRWSRWRWAQRVRFDVIAVDLDSPDGPLITHVKAAFT